MAWVGPSIVAFDGFSAVVIFFAAQLLPNQNMMSREHAIPGSGYPISLEVSNFLFVFSS